MIASVTGSITSAIGDHGIYAVFLLMALDAVFPAFSELVMLYAGALASGAIEGASVTLFGHTISSPGWAFVAMALSGTIGYTVGAVVGWAIGIYGGRPLLERHGRWFHLGPERMERAERWFERWGDWAVFLGRLTPVVRSFCSIPAGVFRMPLGRYTLLTLAGSASGASRSPASATRSGAAGTTSTTASATWITRSSPSSCCSPSTRSGAGGRLEAQSLPRPI